MDSNVIELSVDEKDILRGLFHWKDKGGMSLESMHHYFPHTESVISQLLEKEYITIASVPEKNKSIYNITNTGRIAIKAKCDKQLVHERLMALNVVTAIKSLLMQWDRAIYTQTTDLSYLIDDIKKHLTEYEKNINDIE